MRHTDSRTWLAQSVMVEVKPQEKVLDACTGHASDTFMGKDGCCDGMYSFLPICGRGISVKVVSNGGVSETCVL